MARLQALAGLVVCATLCGAQPAHADPVTDWNAIAMQAIGAAAAAGRPGPPTALDAAMVHAAIYDAVQAIERRFKPYHVRIHGASGSPAAATARAAHDVLVHLFPSQAGALGTTYANYLVAQGLAPDDPGVDVGRQAAAGIIELRADDGSFPATFPPFTGGTGPGEWRPTPPAMAPMLAPWLGDVTPYTLKRSDQFRAVPPPRLKSARYARDYAEVKALGSLTGSDRTDDQTDLAYFWSENFGAQWNRALRAIAAEHVHHISDSSRLFALANLSVADALITAWDSKKHYALWRPSTAIHEGDNDGNRKTDGDPAWTPLIANPPYPDYTSGANNVTGAFTRALALFFGTDHMTFTVTSNAPLATTKTRTYTRFSDAAAEVVEARILLGIHFRFADTVARRQGERVAEWAFKRYFKPRHGHDDD